MIIKSLYPDSFRNFNRYSMKFDPDKISLNRLNDFINAIEPKYEIKRLDEAIYHKALEVHFTADFCSYFSSLEDYLNHGIGYFIMENGEIISGASSYTYCDRGIEITIGTRTEYRKKGLALACAAKLILECIERGIYPRWEAANLESVRLAEKLGYTFEKELEVYSI